MTEYTIKSQLLAKENKKVKWYRIKRIHGLGNDDLICWYCLQVEKKWLFFTYWKIVFKSGVVLDAYPEDAKKECKNYFNKYCEKEGMWIFGGEYGYG